MGNLEDYVDMPGYEDIIVSLDNQWQSQMLRLLWSWSDNALAKIIQLQQFTSKVKREAVCSLIDYILSIDEKVVVFCKYDEEFDFLMDKYKDIAVGINGKIKDRDTEVFEFQNNPQIKVFIGNVQTAGLGITLTAAHKCIIYSETFTWGDAEQARRRIYRIGQKHMCTYYHILVKDSIDELIYKNNKDKTQLVLEFKKLYGGIKSNE